MLDGLHHTENHMLQEVIFVYEFHNNVSSVKGLAVKGQIQ